MRHHNANRKEPMRQVLTPMEVVAAMKEVVRYLWREEARDYQSRTKEERKTHIFRRLAAVRQWLQQRGLWCKNLGLDKGITPRHPRVRLLLVPLVLTPCGVVG